MEGDGKETLPLYHVPWHDDEMAEVLCGNRARVNGSVGALTHDQLVAITS